MIEDVIGTYLDELQEREFDGPFMSLLRSLGYYDIHFLHGSFEFGKDFIAKLNGEGRTTQLSFQTKAGNLGLAEWNACRGQIDMLRTNALAHPAFDASLPRQAVFVTTGRLVGAAPLDAQQYAEHLNVRGEIGFDIWDREKLVELIAATPEIGLASLSIQGTFWELIGHIDQKRVREQELERFSRSWLGSVSQLKRNALEAAVIANRFRRSGRIDQACFVGLCLIRAAWTCGHGCEPPHQVAKEVADLGRALFRYYALALFAQCSADLFDPLNLAAGDPAAYVTYPVRCLRISEILALLALLEESTGASGANEVIQFLKSFVATNPGVQHPISDRWAVSMIPAMLVLGRAAAIHELRNWMIGSIRWVADRYDSAGIGLAGPDATPEQEMDYLLGNPFEHVKVDRRVESYIATVILDMAATLGLGESFVLARNEFLAVAANPPVLEFPDTVSQYVAAASEASFSPNMEYAETWTPVNDWQVAPHHYRSRRDYYLQRIGHWWDHLAISSVVRDRHFLETCRYFLA
jgi:hypothetical protein